MQSILNFEENVCLPKVSHCKTSHLYL